MLFRIRNLYIFQSSKKNADVKPVIKTAPLITKFFLKAILMFFWVSILAFISRVKKKLAINTDMFLTLVES